MGFTYALGDLPAKGAVGSPIKAGIDKQAFLVGIEHVERLLECFDKGCCHTKIHF